MKKSVMVLGLLMTSTTAFALPKPVMVCKSIDPTHRPFYTVKVYPFDATHADYFGVVITKTIDLAGARKMILRREGSGMVEQNRFSIEFGSYAGRGGILLGSDENISGRRGANEILTGELNLAGKRAAELICKP